MKIRKNITCPLEFVHDIISGKWKTVILWELHWRKGQSLAQLKKNIEGISEKVLLEQLKDLQEYGLVGKNKEPGYPLKVEYFTTADKGAKLIEALVIMQELGEEYLKEQGQEMKVPSVQQLRKEHRNTGPSSSS